MRIVTLGSVRGAPGVTTTSLLLASRFADGIAVEADLDGGVIAVRYGLGREPGLTTLAAAGGAERLSWRAHAQDAGGVPVLVGPDAPAACASLWRSAGDRIAQTIASGDGVVIVDAGRLRTPVPLVAASNLVLLVVRPVAEHLVALSHLIPSLRSVVRGEVGALLVGDGPYSAPSIAESLGIRVVGELPDDRAAADLLRDGGSASRLSRSRLARAVSTLGDRLADELLDAGAVAP